jgi:hypothetical protein
MDDGLAEMGVCEVDFHFGLVLVEGLVVAVEDNDGVVLLNDGGKLRPYILVVTIDLMPYEKVRTTFKVAVNHCPYVSNIHDAELLIRTNTSCV